MSSPSSLKPPRYAVIGNPIAHSRSPFIHTAFAQQSGINLVYDKLYAPLDCLRETIQTFTAAGGRGLNITIPFKIEAYALASQLTARAQTAGAVNTLKFDGTEILGDNTDGIGLVRDIQHNLNYPLRGKKIVLLGAGGAARGALLPLLECVPAAIFIANRSPDKAHQLMNEFARYNANSILNAGSFAEIPPAYDILINASASSLAQESPPLPQHAWPFSLVYDMMYGPEPTALLQRATRYGARTADGLGMLVEQAAQSFFLWHGVVPDTQPVLQQLRHIIVSEK